MNLTIPSRIISVRLIMSKTLLFVIFSVKRNSSLGELRANRHGAGSELRFQVVLSNRQEAEYSHKETVEGSVTGANSRPDIESRQKTLKVKTQLLTTVHPF